jgi:hypothetical protein
VTPVVLALVAVVVLGWPPAYALTGRLMLGTLLAPLTAGLLAALAAILMIVIGGRLWYWLVPVFVASVGLAFWLRRQQVQMPHAGPVDIAVLTVPIVPPALSVLQPPIEWDAHAIWWTHAAALTRDAGYVRYMLGSDAFRPTHTDYPPLLPATVATGWTAGGVHFSVAQFVSTAVTLSAIVMLMYAVRTVTAGGPVWASRGAAAATGLMVWAGEPLLVAAGYADHLWSAAAVAGALLLLLKPDAPKTLPVVLLTAAALTKNEGLIFVVLIAAIATARSWRTWRTTAPLSIPVLAGIAWSLVGRAFHAQSDLLAAGGFDRVTTFDETTRHRLDQTVHAMWPAGGRLVAVAAIVAVAGALLLRPYRRRAGIGPDWPLWALLGLYGGALVGTYLISPYDLNWHLSTSIDRTMVPLIVLASASAACWVVAAVGALLPPRGDPAPHPVDRAGAGSGVAASEDEIAAQQ